MSRLKIGELYADIGADTSDLTEAEREVKRTTQKMGQSFDGVDKASKKTGAAFGGLGNVSRQLGFQMQDVAVQLQGGQSAMLVLGQQGSQIASVFGPGGAVIGAFIAIAAAVGGSLLPSLFDSKNALEELEEILKDLDKTVKKAEDGVLDFSEAMQELESISRRAVAAQLTESILKTEEALEMANKQIIKLVDNNVISRGFGQLIRQFKDGELSARDLSDAYDNLFTAGVNAGREPGKEFREFRNELSELVRASEKAEEKLTRLNEAQNGGNLGTTKDDRDEDKRDKERSKKKLAREEELRKRLAEKIAEQNRRLIAEDDAAAAADLERARIATLSEVQIVEEKYQNLIQAARDGQATLQRDEEQFNQLIIDLERKKSEDVQAIHERENLRMLEAAKKRSQEQLAIVNTAAGAISNVLQASGNDQAAKAATLLSSVAAMATTITGIMQAQAMAQALGDPTAITLPQKIANGAIIAAQFAGIFSLLKGGGRQFGGNVSPNMAHPINENGVPEILNQSGKQYLLPTGKGGSISPMKGGSSGGPANVTIISNGTPQTVTGTQMSEGRISVMINDAMARTKKDINSSLSSGRGDTYNALRQGSRVERNIR